MTQPFVNKGKDVFRNPSNADDGPVVMHPAMVVPNEERPTINGEPVVEESHQYVVKKDKNAQD